jgi:hypothetical protein
MTSGGIGVIGVRLVLGGQMLTPNGNVNAPAGIGGNLWGANGGGITPIGNGVSGQTGWNAPVAQTLSDGETATNYIVSPVPNSSAKQQESIAALLGLTADSSLQNGNSSMG